MALYSFSEQLQHLERFIDHFGDHALSAIHSLLEFLVAAPALAAFIFVLGNILILGIVYGVNHGFTKLVFSTGAYTTSWDWQRELVLITGGSSGMGEKMVHEFARHNVKVVSLDRNPPKEKIPPTAHFFQVDVTSPDAVHTAGEEIRSKFGDPTVLINNAGVATGKAILDCSKDEIKRVFDVNIVAHFTLVQEFLPAMIKNNHGHIVSMASVASFLTIASNVDYSCAKVALTAFHEGLTQELRNRYNARGVLTSIVYPFWVRTPLIKNLIEHPTFNDGLLEPEQVAKAVVKQVLTASQSTMFLPGYGRILSGIRGFPAWLQELARDSKEGVLRETSF